MATYIIDNETDNRSFKEISDYLFTLRIKDNKFMLRLYNPDLKGLIPHDKNLTEDQQNAIIEECKVNPWYFFREILKVPVYGPQESKSSEFNISPYTLSIIFLFLNNINQVDEGPRQSLQTFTIMACIYYAYRFRNKDFDFDIITKDLANGRDKLRLFKEIDDRMPHYIYILVVFPEREY